MNLSGLTSLIGEMPAYRELLRELAEREGEHRAVLIEAAKPYLVATLHKELQLPVLLIVSSSEEAKRFYEQLLIWCDEQVQLMLFPEPDALPYEHLAPDPFTEQQRLQVLSSLKTGLMEAGSEAPLIVSSATAVARKTVCHNEFIDCLSYPESGNACRPSRIAGEMEQSGLPEGKPGAGAGYNEPAGWYP